jgi:2-desacetyl-2-hydroxyethyl bacteriochlorophyllide A dehydrogenase
VRNTPDGPAVLEVPDPGGPGLVRLEVVASGICSADLLGFDLGPVPVTLGHEFSARTPDGEVVAVLPNVPCGACDQCLAGRDQLCRVLRPTIHGFFRDGGMADAVAVSPASLVPLPAAVDGRDACLVEPLAVALHALHRLDLAPDARVLVVGAGAIGLCCAAVLRDLGVATAVAARHAHQLRAAEVLGVGPAEAVEYDAVIEAAGTQSALDAAVEHAMPNGKVALAATYANGVRVGLEVSMKEISLIPAFTYGHHHGRRDFDVAAEVLGRTPELVDALVTHRFPLEDASEAFRVASDRAAGAIKVVLEP